MKRLDALYEEQDWLLGVARELLRGRDGAEDLAQETWLKVLKHGPNKIQSSRAFLKTTLRRLFFSKSEADRARLNRENATAAVDLAPSTETLVARTEIQKLLHRALETLPEEQRRSIILRHFGGLSLKAIAEREDVPLETARSRLKRGMSALRNTLDKKNDPRPPRVAIALVAIPEFSKTWAPTLTGGILMSKKLASIAVVILILGASFFLYDNFMGGDDSELTQNEGANASTNSGSNEPSRSVNAAVVPESTAAENKKDSTASVGARKKENAEALPKLNGRLVDTNGLGIAGARIYTHVCAHLPPQLVMDRAALVAFQWKDRQVNEAVTDSEGRFTIEATSAENHDLIAHSRNHRVAAAWGVTPGKEAKLTAALSQPLTVQFKNEDDLPVANAEILVMHFNMQANRHFMRKITTDTNGRLKLPQTVKGDSYALVARHKNYVETSVPPITPDPEFKKKDVEVILKRGRRLRVEFIPPSGRSITPGTTVAIQSPAIFAPILGTIDDKNVLDLPHVPVKNLLHFRLTNASWQIEEDSRMPKAERDRMVDAIARLGEPYRLPDEGDVHLRIHLLALPTVSGLAVNMEGNPVSGLDIELRPVAADLFAMRTGVLKTRSNDQGLFRFNDVPLGPRYIAAVSKIFKTVVDKNKPIDLGAVRVTEMNAFRVELHKDIEHLKLTVNRTGAAKGRVVDADGSGLSGVSVTAFRDFGDTRGARRNAAFLLEELESSETVTDENGNFSLEGLSTDYPVCFVAHSDDLPPACSKPTTIRSGQTSEGVVVRMPSFIEVTLTFQNEEGAPVTDFDVTLAQKDLAPFNLSPFVRRRIKGQELYSERCFITNGNGSFTTRVAPEALQLRATDPELPITIIDRELAFDASTASPARRVVGVATVRTFTARLMDQFGKPLYATQCTLLMETESGPKRFRGYSNTKGILTIRAGLDTPLKLIRGARIIGDLRQDFEPAQPVFIKPNADRVDIKMVEIKIEK